ncbi:3'-5' exonuclease [[Mycobacterium] vasticus]|uniref:3'-5' exonuclease n=1 Tax=[Mycobacterium] vasticus TaxID=2875777 RepID=A0ABU5Z124_9MYCO|nr:3'-5' exonuclease [Mycolicibacter sp. MYC017]MEB3071088.1 3'-5' exonuclease [Mycolicibacter sp. MYC017]
MRELAPFIGVLVLVGLILKYWWAFLLIAAVYGAYRYQKRQNHLRAASSADESPRAGRATAAPAKFTAIRPPSAGKSGPTDLASRGMESAAPVKLTARRPKAAHERHQPRMSDPPNVSIWYSDDEDSSHAVVYGVGNDDDRDEGVDNPTYILPYANLTRLPTGWPADQTTYTAVDLETTGLDPSADRIVEIGLVKFTGDGTIIDEFATLVNNPGSAAEARRVHNIDDADLAGAPSTTDALSEAFAFMAGTVVVSHKWEFEEGFLAAAAEQCGLLLPNAVAACTWRTARRQLDGRGYSAKILYKSATGEFQHNAHTALSDARAVREILLWLLRTSPQRLYLTEEPPRPSSPPFAGGTCLISCRPAPMGRSSMAELIAAFPQSPNPRTGDPDEVENYLALLAECIEDGRLTYDETTAMARQVQRTRLTGTQIRYTHQLAWESQFPDHERPLIELDSLSRRERYLMADALGLAELADKIDAVIEQLDEPKPTAEARYLKGLRIGVVGDTTELVALRERATAHGAKIAINITKTVQWMATVTPDGTDSAHNSARRLGVIMVSPFEGTLRLDEAIRDAELKAVARQREIDQMDAERQSYRDEREAYWRPVWRPTELDYDPAQEWY